MKKKKKRERKEQARSDDRARCWLSWPQGRGDALLDIGTCRGRVGLHYYYRSLGDDWTITSIPAVVWHRLSALTLRYFTVLRSGYGL